MAVLPSAVLRSATVKRVADVISRLAIFSPPSWTAKPRSRTVEKGRKLRVAKLSSPGRGGGGGGFYLVEAVQAGDGAGEKPDLLLTLAPEHGEGGGAQFGQIKRRGGHKLLS